MFCFFFQAEDGIRDRNVTGVQTCALPISEYITRYYGVGHKLGENRAKYWEECETHQQHQLGVWQGKMRQFRRRLRILLETPQKSDENDDADKYQSPRFQCPLPEPRRKRPCRFRPVV